MSIQVAFRESTEITSRLNDASNHLTSLDWIIGIANVSTEMSSDVISKCLIRKNIGIKLEQHDIALHC